jgi:Ni,Fe-hydrogenase I cytochrome b subunit
LNAKHGAAARGDEFGINGPARWAMLVSNENKNGATSEKARLYALCFLILLGVLIIGTGIVLWSVVHDQPEPLRLTKA